MGTSSDIKMVRVTGTGTPSIQAPARVRAVNIVSDGVGDTRFAITDGGATVLDVEVISGTSQYMEFPDEGIRCATAIVVGTATNLQSATIFYS